MQNPHTDTAQTLYEGDQSKLYSGLMSHHHGQDLKSEQSRAQVKRIMKVTMILTIITIVEVVLGLVSPLPRAVNNTFFLLLTLFKAAYIVRVFMHLGDEFKNFLITVLIPLTLFIWFIIAFLADGNFWLEMNRETPTRMESKVGTHEGAHR
jgi:heme/copper-type cytochrome/quinol oxidase subunit 4